MPNSYNNLIREKVSFPDASLLVERFNAPILKCEHHYHPEIEITCIMESTPGICTFGNVSMRFEKGDCFIIPSNAPHQFIYTKGNDDRDNAVICFKFTQALINTVLPALPELQDVCNLFGVQSKGVIHYQLNEARLKQVEDLAGYRDFNCLVETLRFLKSLAREEFRATYSLDEESRDARLNITGLNANMYQRLARALDFVQKNLSSKISIKDTAQQAKLPSETFRKFFRRSMGMGFTEYVVKLRIAQACRLLKVTSSTILDIAMTVGFRNLSNFNRLFLKYCNCSPRQYRCGK